MKTALHSVSYAGVWPGQAKLSLEQFLHHAQELGFEAVMLMAKRPHLSLLDYEPEARKRLHQLLDALGLKVACLAGYTDFCMGGDRLDIGDLTDHRERHARRMESQLFGRNSGSLWSEQGL